MSSTRFDEARDYGFADKALALRERAGLTQRELAALLGVSGRAIQTWEAGLSYPGGERLTWLITLYVERGAFPAGQEEDEAAALWEAVRSRAPRRIVPFDRSWFASLRDTAALASASAPPLPPLPVADAPRRDDWDEAPATETFFGRDQEVATLSHWLLADGCRLIGVLGMGGIGKTLLAARLARTVASRFDVVYWRSLRNAPPVEEWLAGAIAALSGAQALLPDGRAAQLALVLELLRERHALLVLDNLETILEPGAPTPRYREGYAGYGEVLRRMGESMHQGCLLVAGREAPPELAPLAGERGPVRMLRLGGLGREAGRALLRDTGLVGEEEDWDALIARYSGNPLALGLMGSTIGAVFGGDIAAFLAQDVAVFGGIRQLLDAQVGRLSALERAVLTALAVAREPVGFAELVSDLGPGVARGDAVEAVEALQRRSLSERGAGGTFTLHPVVLEYVTARLVETLAREILAGEPVLLVGQPLLKATAKDYVQRSQERLIAQPLLEQLHGRFGRADVVERRLLDLLETWRGRPAREQGYGPGAVFNLLRLLRGNLRGLDFSRLDIRHAYLAGIEMQDASLAGSHLSEVILSEAFTEPIAVALSPDGVYLAMGTSTGEVTLRRVTDRMLTMAVQGHNDPCMGVAVSADGRLVASGSFDGTARLWDAENGRLRATLEGHRGLVWRVALSADGRLVASGSEDGTVKLWEATPVSASSGRLLVTLRGHTSGVRSVALSADGRLVASGDRDGTVKLWAAESGRLLATLRGHTSEVYDVALSADGRLLASGSDDRTVKLWDAESGSLLATLQGHTGTVWGVALSADGRLLASGSYDGTARLWETESGRLLATMQGHTAAVRDVALSADGHVVVSGSQDGTARLWEASTGRLLAILRGKSSAMWGVALSADGRLLASGSQDSTVKLWDAESGSLLATLQGHTGGVRSVALSADGHVVVSGSYDSTARLWEAESGRLLATLQGHSGGVPCVALSGDGRLVVSGGEDGTLRLWEAETGQLRATLRGHSGVVWSVALSADGRLLASGGRDGMTRLWEVESGRLLETLQAHSSIYSVALSTDERLLASSTMDGTVRLWEAKSGKLLMTLQEHSGVAWAIALSANGGLLASGSDDGTVKLWDLSRLPNQDVNPRTLRGDRRCERLDITGLTGVTDAQRAGFLALGAAEQSLVRVARPTEARVVYRPPDTPAPASIPAATPVPLTAPPGASARPPTNLPPARNTFVGRAADLATLTQALDPATHTDPRLLILTGVAGCGKTRLALAVAEEVRHAYADGVWLVELAPLPASPSADPTAVAAAALSALGRHEQPGQALLDTLVASLQARHMLLVLDNCEHVVAASAALATRLLESCPRLQILATSQRALGIADEIVWRVDTLAVPPAVDGLLLPEMLSLVGQSDAVRLFVERAQAVQPGFELSPATAASVVALCRQLDGLPLSIELAAARLNVLPVEDLLARLDDRFRLLRRGGRTTTDRHQTLQTTMDWSYGLLAPIEQALLRRLAVFVGGWEIAAAEAVCGGEDVAPEAVLELLDELLERSLVSVSMAGGAPRYGLLETVRQYGVQQLARADETVAVQDRRLRWCVTLAEQAAPALLGAEQALWLARLEREYDNLRAALQWALDRGRGALGLRLAAGLWQFWRSRSYLSEGRRWLAAVLALPTEDDDATIMTARASALEGAGWLTEDEHDFAQASALFAQGAALRHAMGEDERTTGLLINAAMEARARGDYARATVLLEQSLAQQRARGNRESIKRGGIGLALARLALVLAEQGQHTRARALYEECLALHRELGDREGIGNALLGLGDLARDLGDTVGVRAYCEETLTLFRELGHTWVGFSLNNLALAAYLDGDLALAARRAQESAALFRGLHAGPSLAEALVTLGRVRGAQGAAADAWAHLSEALTLAGVAGPRFVVAAAVDALGVLAVRQGQVRHGVHLLGAVARMRQTMGAPVQPADRPAIEAALAEARGSLGDTPFTDAWAAGQALPVEQLVAQAAAVPEDDVATPERANGDRT